MDVAELEIKIKLSPWFLEISQNTSLLSQCRSKSGKNKSENKHHTHTHTQSACDFLEQNQARLAIYQNVSYLF